MFLSIIIPVHNSAKYLSRCLDSIWSQHLPEDDYEVICVDDCSCDKSYQLLLEISQEHKNLLVLKNSTNLRAGGARNRGVKEAHGDYILFIDSDDYYHERSLFLIYKYQKDNNLDVLVGDMSRESYNGPVSNKLVLNYSDTRIMTGRDFLLANGFPGGPTKYCFRRSLMVDNNVWFKEQVAVEDPDWVWKLPYYARTMQYQPILIHHYVLYPNSSVGAEYKNPKTIFDRIRCANRIMNLKILYGNKDEQKIIEDFATIIYKVGLKYYFAIPFNIEKKIAIIESEFPQVNSFYGIVAFASRWPKVYSLLSSLGYPIFMILLFLKRLFIKR